MNMEMVHIIAPFQVDDEISRMAIQRHLSLNEKADTALWCNEKPHPAFAPHSIHVIEPYKGLLPQAGKLVVVGVNSVIGHWYQHNRFESVMLIHLHEEQERFYRMMHLLTHGGRAPVTLEYGSERIRQIIGLST